VAFSRAGHRAAALYTKHNTTNQPTNKKNVMKKFIYIYPQSEQQQPSSSSLEVRKRRLALFFALDEMR
jgi:hypothetical protein